MITYEVFEQKLEFYKKIKLNLFFYFDEGKLLQVRFEKSQSLQAQYKSNPIFLKHFEQFFNGTKPFDYNQIKFVGTPFEVAVWKQIQKIPRGKTLSYGEIAERIDRPQAYRAVGTAVGKNFFSVIVPCHRVLHTGKNKVGKFGGGEELKKALLHHEGVSLPH